MNKEKLKLKCLIKDAATNKTSGYTFSREDNTTIDLKVYFTQSFKNDIKEGVLAMCEYSGIWLNSYKPIQQENKPNSEEKIKKHTLLPLDIKDEQILTQAILKESVNLCKDTITPNKEEKVKLFKFYFKELYHFITTEEYLTKK